LSVHRRAQTGEHGKQMIQVSTSVAVRPAPEWSNGGVIAVPAAGQCFSIAPSVVAAAAAVDDDDIDTVATVTDSLRHRTRRCIS